MKRIGIATFIVGLLLAPLGQLWSQPVVPHRWIAELGIGGVNDVSPSPDGKFLVIDSAGTLRVYERSTRAQWSLGVSGKEVVWSANGDRIAFQSREEGQQPQIWTMPMNAATGKPAGPAQRATVASGVLPALSPDGRTVAYQRGADIYATPVTGGEERLLVDEPQAVGRVQYSPDGNWLYFLSRDAANAPGIRRKPVSGGSSTSLGLSGLPLGLSADGKYLAYYSTVPHTADDAAIGFATADGAEFARLRLPVNTWRRSWSGRFPHGTRTCWSTGPAGRPSQRRRRAVD